MDTNETTAVRRGPGRPPKTPETESHAPVMAKQEAPAPVVGIEVVVVRPYRPLDDAILIQHGLPTEGVAAKLPAGVTLELPMAEAKHGIRNGSLTFPAQEL